MVERRAIRQDRGRGHTYILDGERVDGVTRILGDGVPKPALPPWAARTVAEYVGERLEYDGEHWRADRLVADLAKKAQKDKRKFRPESRIDIIDNLKGVHYDERDAAANRGTEVHRLAERLARGEEVDVPEELVGHVDSYLLFLKEWEPDLDGVLLERPIVNRRWHYMGTFDIVTTIGGVVWLIDIKTGRSGAFPDMALQQALYRYAETYVDEAGDEQPMPPIDRCGILWVRADGYDLIPVLADETIQRIALYAQQVGRFLQRDDIIGEALRP